MTTCCKCCNSAISEIAYNENNNHLKIIPKRNRCLVWQSTRPACHHPPRGSCTELQEAVNARATVPTKRICHWDCPIYRQWELFEALRTLRKRLADQEALHCLYQYCPTKCSTYYSASRPTTIEEFGNISGIGEYKQKKWKPEFVELIKYKEYYLHCNKIPKVTRSTPSEMVFRSQCFTNSFFFWERGKFVPYQVGFCLRMIQHSFVSVHHSCLCFISCSTPARAT